MTLAVGAAALALAATALAYALRTIEVHPDAPVHEIEALGIVYPAVNAAALVVLALAALGFVALLRGLVSIARQAAAQRALRRTLSRATLHQTRDSVSVFVDTNPVALCAGLIRPRIYVSDAALDQLSPDELAAVLAHEAHHRTRRDPLRLAVAQTLQDALFFLPPVKRLAGDHARATELDADAAASHPAGDHALARAMLQLGTDPARVDSLLGRPPRHVLPLLVGLAVTAGLLIALLVLVLAGRTATGSATLAFPGVSKAPCIVALALIPGALAILAAAFLRRR